MYRVLIPLVWLAACGSSDADGDGVLDEFDAFPEDPAEAFDRDDDGVGDNSDAFPANPNASTDSDGDGYGEDADCDDTSADVNPAATEVPYNGTDDDCDPATPDDDLDGDGVLLAMDCNDEDPGVSLVQPAFVDGDGDGFGAGDAVSLCVGALPDSHSAVDGDCDDADTSINPGALEVPYDGTDQDCVDGDLWDVDGDGFTAIGAPVGSADDCDDFSALRVPGSAELFDNGIDDDCNATTADDDADLDDDGFDSIAAGGNDCDDQDPDARPDGIELPDNGRDDDCSGGDLSALGGAGRFVNNAHPSCSPGGGDSAEAPACAFDDLTLVDGDVVFVGGGPYNGLRLDASVQLHGGYDASWQRVGRTRLSDNLTTLPVEVRAEGDVLLTGLHLVPEILNASTGLLVSTGAVTARDLVVDVLMNDQNATGTGIAVLGELPFVGQDLRITVVADPDAYGVAAFDSPVMLRDSDVIVRSLRGDAIGLLLDGLFAPFMAELTRVGVDVDARDAASALVVNEAGVAVRASALSARSRWEDARTVRAMDALEVAITDSALHAEGGENAVAVSGDAESFSLASCGIDVGWADSMNRGVDVLTPSLDVDASVIRVRGAADAMAGGIMATGGTTRVAGSVVDIGRSSGVIGLDVGFGPATVVDSQIHTAFAEGGSVGIVSTAGITVVNTSVVLEGGLGFSVGVNVLANAPSFVVHSVVVPGVSIGSIGINVPLSSELHVVNSVVATGMPFPVPAQAPAAFGVGEVEFASLTVDNCAVWVQSDDAAFGYSIDPAVEASTLAAFEAGEWGGIAAGTVRLDSSPFESMGLGDYHLVSGTPLEGAGVDPSSLGLDIDAAERDIDGDVRTTWDIGLDERQPDPR